MGKKRKRKWFRLGKGSEDHLIQAIFIFSSVFLAFMLNEYRLDRGKKQDKQRALQAIVYEIESNLQVLKRWAPYHGRVSERALSFIEGDSIPNQNGMDLALVIGDSTTLMKEFLTRHAWTYANEQNIHFDLQTRIEIIKVYQQQEYVEDAVRRLSDLFFSRDMLRPALAEENFKMFYSHIGDLYGQEEAMIESYQRALDWLKRREDL